MRQLLEIGTDIQPPLWPNAALSANSARPIGRRTPRDGAGENDPY